MAITKKSLIGNSPASKSTSKSTRKVTAPAAAAKLATASRAKTTSKLLPANRAVFAKVLSGKALSARVVF